MPVWRQVICRSFAEVVLAALSRARILKVRWRGLTAEAFVETICDSLWNCCKISKVNRMLKGVSFQILILNFAFGVVIYTKGTCASLPDLSLHLSLKPLLTFVMEFPFLRMYVFSG